MNASGHCGCGCECCEPDVCDCGPAEFVRLRYYYGQRLGALDFSDAQSYVVGKQRFHNLRLHGSGVLCGLKATREVFPQGAPETDPSTILRVSRGAAIDDCGREVIVTGDQCIDVAAWFARNRERLKLTSWGPGQPQTLWVVLRYRECPSDPSPAPRDPCGCDTGGCEFGRIREGFELALLPEEPECTGGPFPSPSALEAALAGRSDGGSDEGTALDPLGVALAGLLAEGCPQPSGDRWICLARLEATLEAQDPNPPRIHDISQPDNALAGRSSLLSTRAIQSMLATLAVSASDEGLTGPGPTIGGMTFTAGGDATSGDLIIAVNLVSEGDPPQPVELAQPTFQSSFVKVSRFDANKWTNSPPTKVTYDPARGIVLHWDTGALAAGRYRVSISAPPETPIVDAKMRPLRPARFARHLRLQTSGSTLELAETLY